MGIIRYMKELSKKDIDDYKQYIKKYSKNSWCPYIFLVSRFHDMNENEINNLLLSEFYRLYKEIEIWVVNNYNNGKRITRIKVKNKWELLDI